LEDRNIGVRARRKLLGVTRVLLEAYIGIDCFELSMTYTGSPLA
jgi:hypothetical protein